MIRPAKPTDAPAIAAIYSPYVLETCITYETVPPTAEEMKERILAYSRNYPYLVYTKEDEVVGYAYASPFASRAAFSVCVEVSVYVHLSHRGKGVGQALIVQLLSELQQDPSIYTAAARINHPNPASQRLFESLGFTPQGILPNVARKMNRWLSLMEYTLPLKPYDIPPSFSK